MGLCLRKRLGSSELPRLDVLSPDAWVLSRALWLATWQELCHFAANGGSFQIRSILHGGMDPGRQAALAAINFKAETDWNVLERLFAQVRRQEQMSADEPADYKATAELIGEASPLWQWALMEAVPGLSGQCDAGPARMTALSIILERQHARVRVVPPSVKAGLSGQLIEVRFNNRVSPESIKDSVLMAMETLAPQIWADDAFVLVFRRRSIKLEGNTADLKLFSFTVVLPFGPMARRKGLHVVVQLGVEDQYQLALKLQLPVCPQYALYRMVEPRENAPPLRITPVRTLLMNRNVLLGPLPSGWLSNRIEIST